MTGGLICGARCAGFSEVPRILCGILISKYTGNAAVFSRSLISGVPSLSAEHERPAKLGSSVIDNNGDRD